MGKTVTRQTRVTGMLAFALADMLGLDLQETRDPVGLKGEAPVEIEIDGFKLEFKQKVVASRILANAHFIVVKAMGNLVLLLSSTIKANKEEGQLTLVNLALLGIAPEKLLDTHKPTSHADLVAAVGPAAGKTFTFKGKWAQAKG